MSANIIKTNSEKKWLVMASVGLGVFASTINMSIINISLPAIQTAFEADLSTTEWIVLIYSVIQAVLLITVGRLSDIIGRKRLFILGTIFLSLGSLLCGLSTNIIQLILARAVQSVAGALLVANSAALVTDAFPPREFGVALGSLSSIVAIGFTFGPTLGGLILERASWPMIFFVSIPLGLLAAVLGTVSLHEHKTTSRQHFDLVGAITLSIFLFSGLLGITNGQENGWSSPILIILVLISIFSGALFFRIELRARYPVIDIELFRRRLVSIPLLSCLLYFLSISANTFLMPFLLQQSLGYSVQVTGLMLISVPITIALVAPFGGWLSDRIGSQILSSLGLALCGLALFLLSKLSMDASVQNIIPWLIVLGLGGALFNPPNNSALMGAVPADRRGVTAGLLATSRHLGITFGTVFAGLIWVSRTAYYKNALSGGAFRSSAELFGIKDALFVASVICFSTVILAWNRGSQKKVSLSL
jgi:EmrB/QacA subfamily drug resistance transporter